MLKLQSPFIHKNPSANLQPKTKTIQKSLFNSFQLSLLISAHQIQLLSPLLHMTNTRLHFPPQNWSVRKRVNPRRTFVLAREDNWPPFPAGEFALVFRVQLSIAETSVNRCCVCRVQICNELRRGFGFPCSLACWFRFRFWWFLGSDGFGMAWIGLILGFFECVLKEILWSLWIFSSHCGFLIEF